MKEDEPAFVMSEFSNDKQIGDIALKIELELDKIKNFTLEGSVDTSVIQGGKGKVGEDQSSNP